MDLEIKMIRKIIGYNPLNTITFNTRRGILKCGNKECHMIEVVSDYIQTSQITRIVITHSQCILKFCRID